MSLGLPGYYDPSASPPVLIPFPVAPQWGSDDQNVTEEDVYGETASGQPWVRKLYARLVITLMFLVTETDLEFFRDLHQSLGGQDTPFLFVEDVSASPLNATLVRKEQNFAPKAQQNLVVVDGVKLTLYAYTMTLKLELQRMNLTLIVNGVTYTNASTIDEQTALNNALLSVSPAPVVVGIDQFGNEYSLPVTYLTLGGEVFALPGGTPISALLGFGWVAGQMDTLRNAGITPFLLPGSADFYEWYGV